MSMSSPSGLSVVRHKLASPWLPTSIHVMHFTSQAIRTETGQPAGCRSPAEQGTMPEPAIPASNPRGKAHAQL